MSGFLKLKHGAYFFSAPLLWRALPGLNFKSVLPFFYFSQFQQDALIFIVAGRGTPTKIMEF